MANQESFCNETYDLMKSEKNDALKLAKETFLEACLEKNTESFNSDQIKHFQNLKLEKKARLAEFLKEFKNDI